MTQAPEPVSGTRNGRYVCADQPNHVLAKMRIWEVEDPDGGLTFEVDPLPDLCNPFGSPHASVLAGLIDCSAASAAVLAAGTEMIAGADLTVRFLGMAKAGPVRAISRVLRAGRTSIVVQTDVIDVGAGRRLLASGTMSFTRVKPA
jgi:uncharacterized protein (TIGR00369 family)